MSALVKHWPERAQALLAEPARGLGVIVGAIDLGLVLADAAELPGFDAVLSRVRAGDRSAESELTVAAVLARTGLAPAFGVQAGTKVPDIAITTGPTITFIEVIAPNRAEIVKEFTQRIEEIASSIAAANPSMNVEFFLDGDLDEVDLVALTKQVAEAPCSDEIQDIRPYGRFLKRAFTFPPVVSRAIPSATLGTVLGVAKGAVQPSTGTLAAVRGPVFDARAKRLVVAELHHFTKTNPNVVVIDTGNVPGGFQDWGPSITRCFQPTQNTRISAVVLYQTGLLGIPLAVHRAWKIMVNQYAANPLPQAILQAFSALPEVWPSA
ncbi:MAG: hypothetical protein ACYDAB_03540 [bacterium]